VVGVERLPLQVQVQAVDLLVALEQVALSAASVEIARSIVAFTLERF